MLPVSGVGSSAGSDDEHWTSGNFCNTLRVDRADLSTALYDVHGSSSSSRSGRTEWVLQTVGEAAEAQMAMHMQVEGQPAVAAADEVVAQDKPALYCRC
jgi:hypothetical protein